MFVLMLSVSVPPVTLVTVKVITLPVPPGLPPAANVQATRSPFAGGGLPMFGPAPAKIPTQARLEIVVMVRLWMMLNCAAMSPATTPTAEIVTVPDCPALSGRVVVVNVVLVARAPADGTAAGAR